MSGEPTLTKAQVIERDDPLRVRHPLASWLGHDDYCPASRMALDMNSVEGPCTCGLTEALAQPGTDAARPRRNNRKSCMADAYPASQGHCVVHDSIWNFAYSECKAALTPPPAEPLTYEDGYRKGYEDCAAARLATEADA